MKTLRKRKQEEVQEQILELDSSVLFDRTNHTASWQTLRPPRKRFSSLTQRLMAIVSFTVLAVIAVLMLVMNLMWKAQMRAYSEASVETLAQSVGDTLGLAYSQTHSWSSVAVTITRSLSSQLEDMQLCVLDTKGNVQYNSFDPKESAFKDTPSQDEVVRTAEIKDDEEVVGSLKLRQAGLKVFSDKDQKMFLSNNYQALWVTILFCVAASVGVSFFATKWMVRPLRKITATIHALRNGDMSARTGLRGKDDVGHMGQTLDAMAASVERSISAERRLTSDVAHELRTPLMAILVNVEGMQDGVIPTDDEHLALVANEVKRLSRLVDALLQLSRLENDTHSFHFEVKSVGPLVREIVAAQKPLFQSQDLTLTYLQNASDAQLMARIDADTLNRAIVNILSNALRYTNADGRVSLTLGRAGDDITIAVADTGIGMDKKELEHVFSRFWRSDASRARVSGGLGIGLSLTSEIVAKHNGFINVESEKGAGTIFTIHIPVAKASHGKGE